MADTTPRPATVLHVPAASGAYTSLVALCLVQAWVWGFSTLDKVVSPLFVSKFGTYVSGHLGNSLPSLYVTFLRNVVLRAPGFFARASIGTELLLTLAFLTAAGLLTFPRVSTTRLAIFGVAAASFGGFMFAINLAVLNGDASPWTVGGSPFASGVQVEYLLAGISLMTTAAAAVLLRRTRYLRAYRSRRLHQGSAPALAVSGDPG
ncbi:MAG: hypothetical protein NVSMB29_09060 [Candidatus Dormibacteria bacterium]